MPVAASVNMAVCPTVWLAGCIVMDGATTAAFTQVWPHYTGRVPLLHPCDAERPSPVLMSSFYVISPMCSHRVPDPTELGDALVVGRQSANFTFWIAKPKGHLSWERSEQIAEISCARSASE